MGASAMASGRKPSMLRMITRRIAGRAVSVGEGTVVVVNVSVGAGVIVDVELETGDNEGTGVGVRVRVDNWHAIRSARSVAYIVKIRVVFIVNDCNTTCTSASLPLDSSYNLLIM